MPERRQVGHGLVLPYRYGQQGRSPSPVSFLQQQIHGRRYIDGGICSATNADLAKGYDRLLILVAENRNNVATVSNPLLHRVTLDKEVAGPKQAGGQVLVITADEASVAARGPNPLDASRCGVLAKADRAQGTRAG